MSFRIERINNEIQKSISETIRTKLKNPDITEMISVMSVETAKDLKHANVYVSIYGDKSKTLSNLDALIKSAGFIRKELSADLSAIRTVPELHFILDTSQEYSERMEKLLQTLKDNK